MGSNKVKYTPTPQVRMCNGKSNNREPFNQGSKPAAASRHSGFQLKLTEPMEAPVRGF
jgi:hypothetical protein